MPRARTRAPAAADGRPSSPLAPDLLASRRAAPRLRIGIGGWTFPPWRGPFYPPGLPQAEELAYASRALSALEINATFYRTQSRASFARWAAETPDDFVFTVKAPRAASQRKDPAEAQDSIAWFLASGLDALGGKLGPILWQFAGWQRFEPAAFAAFLALLPGELAGRPLRHAVEAAHTSFAVPQAADLAHAAGVALALRAWRPDPAAPFVYARLRGASRAQMLGYAPADLDAIAADARRLAADRDVFVFIIDGDKERAPLAARALVARLAAAAA